MEPWRNTPNSKKSPGSTQQNSRRIDELLGTSITSSGLNRHKKRNEKAGRLGLPEENESVCSEGGGLEQRRLSNKTEVAIAKSGAPGKPTHPMILGKTAANGRR